MKQDLLEILVDIFKSSGYNTTISSQFDIFVEKNRHKAYVRYALEPDCEDIKAFSEKIGDCTGIYVMTRKGPEELISYATEFGIYIWDRDELALQIGRAVLVNLEQKANTSYSEHESQISSEVRDQYKQTIFELPVENWKLKEGSIGESDFDGDLLPIQEQQSEAKKNSIENQSLTRRFEERKNLGKQEQVEVPETESYEMVNIRSIEPRISKNQAIIIAKPYLINPKDAILKFVPFWKYKYNVEAEKRFRSKVLSIVGKGNGLLNALNKSKEEMEIEGLSTPTKVPAVQYELKRPIVDKKQAEKILLDFIKEENTREIRFNNTEGQAVIYEHRSIGPRSDEIQLDIELVYIPVWEVKGKRNSLEINAYNAKVLEEPVDEDAEFL
ncbi:hypothetical protein [Methanosarcina sp.]|uniref:hypothetical protein n=1 Tax=Methanosarcina sp. TaxID=2213 RepID=UPI0029882DD7|nr:hypothetical protein [Methanosarcina sp.]MDW5552242.1 hypothetical protein [Methanosarcina sp.]MDW5555993.1 hypothetical protein [Methanosarcina sp.]MDW5561516.1 hypothetical protein [Methanosarcina sp.]